MSNVVTIMTSERPVSYLEQTVKSIPEGFEVEYVVQGEVKLPKKGNVTKVHRPYASDENRHRDATYNYAMAMLSTEDGLVIEDDVIFCKNFEKIYEALKKQLPEGKYAIALYSCYNWQLDSGKMLVDYPVDDFYGTQALLYDKETAIGFGEYLLHHLDYIGGELWDMALKRYIKEIDPDVKLYATRLSLVQHIGNKSSIDTTGHQASNFIDDIL